MPISIAIRETAINRAIAFLNAAEVQYKIVMDGVTIHNTIPEILAPRKKVHDFVKTTGYSDKIRALQPSQHLQFVRADYSIMADDDAWTSFKASISSLSFRIFGKDNYIIENGTEGVCEVLRVN